MKEYIEPIVEVIELSGEDIIVTSSSPKGTGSDLEPPTESIFGANGIRFD